MLVRKIDFHNLGILKLQGKMAVPLDQQFKIVKKGIIEERIPVLVNFKKKIILFLFTIIYIASIWYGTTLFCNIYSITNKY